MTNPDDLINKKRPVPVLNLKRFPEPEQIFYTYTRKDGKRELKPSALKKIKWRLEHEADPNA